MPRLAFLALFFAAACSTGLPGAGVLAPPDAPVALDTLDTGTDALLVSVDAAPGVVWTAGTAGTWGRSLDGGRSWTMGTVPGADTLQFRDVEAFSRDEAVLLSIGNGAASRIYTTADGGRTWALRWTNPEPEAFYDCMAFFSRQQGFAFSDAVGTRLPLIETRDGGRTWTAVDRTRVPAARPGEGGYASSGTCAVADGSRAWIVTNGGDGPDRVLRTENRGRSWQAVETPIGSDDGGRGLATLAVGQGVLRAAVLGAIENTTLLRSDDGGATWRRDGKTEVDQVYGLAAVPVLKDADAWVAVGPGGLDVQRQGGSWQHLTDTVFWGVVATGPRTAVAVGRGGKVGLVTF